MKKVSQTSRFLDNLEDYEKKTKLLAQQFDWKYIATQYLKMLKSI